MPNWEDNEGEEWKSKQRYEIGSTEDLLKGWERLFSMMGDLYDKQLASFKEITKLFLLVFVIFVVSIIMFIVSKT
jgi:hypothetical protein